MMNIILWRHAQAEIGEPDETRRLTAKGKKQSAEVGKWLRYCLPAECKILSSPAARCVETAESLGRYFETSKVLAIDSDAEKIISTIDWPNSQKSILIIGHQPLLGHLASLLIAGIKQDWTIRKGGVLWIAQKAKDSKVYIHQAITPN